VPNLSPGHIRQRLAAHRAVEPDAGTGAEAAVAVVLRFDSGVAEVLLMKRAERADDRWSGHVSFPGGRRHPNDLDLLATALRETREEVGLDLAHTARVIGRLDSVRAIAQGKIQPLVIHPFVFEEVAPAPLVLGDEAESAFWLPLAEVAAGGLDAPFEYLHGPTPLTLPSWRYQDYVVWGLTHHMLQGLLEVTSTD
jgi:8-oxo-dGTP pyrophosphatase MutT (NUDIX family)